MADDKRSTAPDLTRYAIFAGPDSLDNLSGWIFVDGAAAERARTSYPRGAVVAVLPDAATHARISGECERAAAAWGPAVGGEACRA